MDTIVYREKHKISEWNKNTFELNYIDMRKLKKLAKKQEQSLNTDSLVLYLSERVHKLNSFFIYSSIVKFLIVNFEYEGKKYQLSQSNLGGFNLSWNIKIDNHSFYIISPEANKLISAFLSNKMPAKKWMREFMDIEELEKIISRQDE